MLAFAPAAHNMLRDRLKRVTERGEFGIHVEGQKLRRLAKQDRHNALMELERITGELTNRMPSMRTMPLELRRRELIGKLVH